MTDHEIPWGMQIAVRYDKVRPPRRIDVAEAAARAVVALLASPRTAPGGDWHDAVEHWRSGRIRKLVRRARGRRWEEVQDLPGITVEQEGPAGWGPAAARAAAPAPARPCPPALANTPVAGPPSPPGGARPPPPAAVAEAVARDPGAATGIELTDESVSPGAPVTVEVTPLEGMTSGKLCAQVAHAAQLAWQSPAMPGAVRSAWAAQDYRIRVVFPTPDAWRDASRPVSVVDAGFTELDGRKETTRALW